MPDAWSHVMMSQCCEHVRKLLFLLISSNFSAIEQGDPDAAEQLLLLLYDELRKLATAKMTQEDPGQTL